MNSFIFGFHLLVWWPKWTPASNSSFIVIEVDAKKILPLTLGILEPLAGTRLAILLAFLDPRVPREKPCRL
jgi:hypothetical protein